MKSPETEPSKIEEILQRRERAELGLRLGQQSLQVLKEYAPQDISTVERIEESLKQSRQIIATIDGLNVIEINPVAAPLVA